MALALKSAELIFSPRKVVAELGVTWIHVGLIYSTAAC